LDGRHRFLVSLPTEPREIHRRIFSANCFVHSSMTFRRKALLAIGGYSLEYPQSQDYELLLRLTGHFKLANLDEPLVRYRIHPDQVSIRKLAAQRRLADKARERQYEFQLSNGVLPDGVTRPIPTFWDKLRGEPSTVGRDYLEWSKRYYSLDNPTVAFKLAIRALMYSPLSGETYRQLKRILRSSCPLARKAENRLAWYARRTGQIVRALAQPRADSKSMTGAARPRILFISHDAYPAGAQIFLLNMVRWFASNTNFDVSVALRTDGEMRASFESICKTYLLGTASATQRVEHGLVPRALQKLNRFKLPERRYWELSELIESQGFDVLYFNTITLGDLLERLRPGKEKIVTHVHELSSGIRQYARGRAKVVLERSDHVICVSDAVSRNLASMAPTHAHKLERIYGFVPIDVQLSGSTESLRDQLLGPHMIPSKALIIGSCGNVSVRKGADLAVPLMCMLPPKVGGLPLHFVWIGPGSDDYPLEVAREDALRAGLAQRVHFVGRSERPADWFSLLSVHVLLSREDSYPLVVMEAALQRVPTVCFVDGGGAPEFVRNDAGAVTPYLDLAATAAAINELLADARLRETQGKLAMERVRAENAADVILPRVEHSIRRLLSLSK